ncbi:unnamed protein product [Ixodes pacificus]
MPKHSQKGSGVGSFGPVQDRRPVQKALWDAGWSGIPPTIACARRTRLHRGKAIGDIGDLLDYFDSTYVNGPFHISSAATSATRASLAVIMHRRRPEFHPKLGNVHEATLQDEDRTNNACEGWNNGFQKLVGHTHPSVWRLIKCLQQDQALVAPALIKEQRGEPPVKRVRKSTERL